jgi:hypothetical protein
MLLVHPMPAGQTVPHMPQFIPSVVGSTHAPLHSICGSVHMPGVLVVPSPLVAHPIPRVNAITKSTIHEEKRERNVRRVIVISASRATARAKAHLAEAEQGSQTIASPEARRENFASPDVEL